VPIQFTDIEIAKARPNHARSVRRWRSVNRPISNGPFASPATIITSRTTMIEVAKGRTAIAAKLITMATRIS